MRKFRRAPEAAIGAVEDAEAGLDHLFDYARRKVGSTAEHAFGVTESVHEVDGLFFDVFATLAECFRNREENLGEAGALIRVCWREVGASVKRLALGRKENSEWPSTLSADGSDGRLVTRINVGSLIAIDLHGNEMFFENGRDVRGFIGLAIHDVT